MMKTGILFGVLVALLVIAPSGAGAETRLGRSSGPFRMVGTDGHGNPQDVVCGELNLYKTDAGREWRLEDTCDALMTALAGPPPTPRITHGTPIPPTPASECPDGFLSRINSSQWGLSNVNLTEGKDHVWCVDLPQTTRFFFEVKTVNKGNTSCSDVEMTATSPGGVEYFSNGSQPGVPPLSSPGRWRIKLHLNEGCSRYDLNVVY